MFLDRSLDPERHSLEPPEDKDDSSGEEGEEGGFGVPSESTRREDEVVAEVTDHEDGEPEWRKLEGAN